jgi:hypothetical protein
MTAPAKRAATYADIEALPPHLIGEIINGALYTQPRPAPPHTFSTSTVGRGRLAAGDDLEDPACVKNARV